MWGGITASYWTSWQTAFNRQVLASEIRLNRRVKRYMEQFMRARNNGVLFNPQIISSKPKQREYKAFKAVQENRFTTNMRLSDMFDGESEYSNFFTAPVDEKKRDEPYFLGKRGSQIFGNKSEHTAGKVYVPRK
jgi:hypothetical protein